MIFETTCVYPLWTLDEETVWHPAGEGEPWWFAHRQGRRHADVPRQCGARIERQHHRLSAQDRLPDAECGLELHPHADAAGGYRAPQFARRGMQETTMRCCGWRVRIARRRSKALVPRTQRSAKRWRCRSRARSTRALSHGCRAMRSRALACCTHIPGHDNFGHCLMNLHRLLNARLAAGKPVRVALIGAGNSARCFCRRCRTRRGSKISVIDSISTDAAKRAAPSARMQKADHANGSFADRLIRAIPRATQWTSWWRRAIRCFSGDVFFVGTCFAVSRRSRRGCRPA